MNKGERNGILWWNLRDGWPIISDATVDYYGGKKLAYTYIKRVQTDVCVMIGDADAKGHPVEVVNDTRENKRVEIRIVDKDAGRSLLRRTVEVAANGKLVVDHLPQADQNSLWMIDYTVDGVSFQNHYLAYRPPMDFGKYKDWLSLLK
jgi:beta-mannosidase